MYDQQHSGKKQDKTHWQSKTVDIKCLLNIFTNLPNTMHRGEYINSISKNKNGHQSHKRQKNYSTEFFFLIEWHKPTQNVCH